LIKRIIFLISFLCFSSLFAFDNKTYFAPKKQNVAHYHWSVAPALVSDWAFTYGFNKNNFISAFAIDTKLIREPIGDEISFALTWRFIGYNPFSTLYSDYSSYSFTWQGFGEYMTVDFFKPLKLLDGLYLSSISPVFGVGAGALMKACSYRANDIFNQKFSSDFTSYYLFGVARLGTDVSIVRNLVDVNVIADFLLGKMRTSNHFDPVKFIDFDLPSFFYSSVNLSLSLNFYFF